MPNVAVPRPPSFPSLVQKFFTEYLVTQRALSPQTIASYRDALMLFLDFAHQRLRKAPTALRLADIEPDLILAFLDHLEQKRHNTVRSRNLRLTALRAFLKFAARRDVSSLHVIERALGVPMKRFERPMLGFLSREEMLAVLGEPGSSWTSQRDHLLLAMLYNTGGRVSEIIGVRVADVVLDRPACVHLRGKGRKQRSVPLWKTTVQEVRAWLRRNPTLGKRRSLAAEPRRPSDDARQRQPASGHRRDPGSQGVPQSRQTEHLAAHHSAYDRNAPAAVGRGLQRDCAMPGPRERDHHAPIRRGRSGNEGQGTGAAATTRHQDAPLSPTRRPDAVPSGTVTMYRPRTAPLPAGAGAVLDTVPPTIRSSRLYIETGSGHSADVGLWRSPATTGRSAAPQKIPDSGQCAARQVGRSQRTTIKGGCLTSAIALMKYR